MKHRHFILSVILFLLSSAVGVCYGAENSDGQSQEIIQNNALFNAVDNAMEDGSLDEVKKLLDSGANVNAKNEDGETALHLAARWNIYELVKCLADHGADVNAKDCYGDSVLHIAARWGDLKVIQCLVEHGADVNAKNDR